MTRTHGIDVQGATLAVTCTACKMSFIVGREHMASIPVRGGEAGAVERGFRCPNCKAFYRSGWDNSTLAEMRAILARARGQLRAQLTQKYLEAFTEFQRRMSEK